MQGTGYVILDGKKVLVLWRVWKHKGKCLGRYLKLRLTGKDGDHLTDEEAYLNLPDQDARECRNELLAGKTICL